MAIEVGLDRLMTVSMAPVMFLQGEPTSPGVQEPFDEVCRLVTKFVEAEVEFVEGVLCPLDTGGDRKVLMFYVARS